MTASIHHIRRFAAYLCILGICLVLFEPVGTTAAAGKEKISPSLLGKRYRLALDYYHNLAFHKGVGLKRENWERGVRLFRRLYLADPKQDQAARALFVMGRMYYDMSRRFRNPLDLGEAVAYYQDVASLFPEHSLADDALLILGRIYLYDQDDRQRAAGTLLENVDKNPRGDRRPAAVQLLTTLKDVEDTDRLSAAADNNRARVLPVKFWSNNDYTRVVVRTTAPVDFKEQLLEEMHGQPRRLYIDFADSQLSPEARAPVPIQDGLLKQVRTGQFTRETVRVVLDIESIFRYKIFSLDDPFRVVIDVKGREEPARPPPVIASAGKKQPGKEKRSMNPAAASAPEPAPVISLARQLGLGIQKVVIDPGHGGKDPGAIAANGVMEKDVVLKVARRLAARLERDLGCEVVLTRTTDVFIPLEERTALANTNRGDLFISLHVNAAPSPSLNGVETYFLDMTNDEDAMRLAAFENATSASKVSDLQNLLADLLSNTKKEESARLAKMVQENMAAGLRLRNLGVKQAPFYVLIGAQMPAVLIEIGFLSNPSEARRLRSDRYLVSIADRLAEGVAEYVNNNNLAMAERK